MPSIEHQDYKGYVIVAMATPAAGGKYHSVFAVNAAGQAGQASAPAPLHQEKITDHPPCATEAEAIDGARARAQAWIDTQAG